MNEQYFALIDTETTYSNKLMTLGVLIVDSFDYTIIDKGYYVLIPEMLEGGMYLSAVPYPRSCDIIYGSRETSINRAIELIKKYDVESIFAYNASFDYGQLPELSFLKWYDIVKIVAYKQFNPIIANLACHSTGRLKSGYNVENMMRLLNGDEFFKETHNAINDAEDELEIMRLLGKPMSVYLDNARIKD